MDINELELYAWVGEDELGSGEIGMKQGLVPAGLIPLVATKRAKVDRQFIRDQMAHQQAQYGKRIVLARFRFDQILSVANEDDFVQEIISNVPSAEAGGGRDVVLKCGHVSWWAAGPPENATKAYCAQCLDDALQASKAAKAPHAIS
ncbi:MAG TPA: hypothetical protein VGG55_02490 [Candidatus Acidoferrales bacterium]|jgi:hypothetical protein